MHDDQTVESHAPLHEHKLPVLLTDAEFEQLRSMTDSGHGGTGRRHRGARLTLAQGNFMDYRFTRRAWGAMTSGSLLSLGFLAATAFAQNFSGTFQGDNLTLVLKSVPKHPNLYTGTVSLGSQKFPAKGQWAAKKLEGSFQSGGQSFPFSLRPSGNGFALSSGNTTYNLRSLSSTVANPLAQNSLNRVPSPTVPKAATKPAANDKSGYLGIATMRDDEDQMRILIVVEGGPAERAGLKRGDIIKKVAGRALTNDDEMLALMRGPVGSRVPLVVSRENEDGGQQELTVTVVRGLMPKGGGAPTPTWVVPVPKDMASPRAQAKPQARPRPTVARLAPGLSGPLAMGTRIIYSGGDSVVQGASSRLVPSGEGEWQDAQGRRWKQEQLQSSGGVGYVSLDIVQTTPNFIAADVRNFLIGFNNTTSLAGNSVMVGDATALGDPLLRYWIAPVRLARMSSGRSGGHQVSRVRTTLGGRTYDGISISDTSATAYANEIYDLKTGLLISSSRSNRGGDQRALEGNNQLGNARGATVMSHLRLVGTRQLQLPWGNSPAPSWAAAGRRLDYQGSVQNVMQNSGLPPLPPSGASYSCSIQRVIGGCVLANTLARFETGSGLPPQEAQTLRCFATTSIGSLWVPPGALAKLRPNQVIDQDPITQFRVTYLGVQNNVAIFQEQGAIDQFYYAYNPQNGMLVGFDSSKRQSGIAEQRVQFRLAGAP